MGQSHHEFLESIMDDDMEEVEVEDEYGHEGHSVPQPTRPKLGGYERSLLFEDCLPILERTIKVFRWNEEQEPKRIASWRGNSTVIATAIFEILHVQEDNTFSCWEQNDNFEPSSSEEFLAFCCILLNFYLRQNCTGPPTKDEDLPKSFLKGLAEATANRQEDLICDGEELVENTRFPILIVVVEDLLEQIDILDCPTASWWKIRAYFLHQKILEEKSQQCWKKILKAKEEFEEAMTVIPMPKEELAVFYSELSQVYAYYYDIEGAKDCLTKAKEFAGIRITPTGALGKRTKFQQMSLAQLVLKVEKVEEADDTEFEDGRDVYLPENKDNSIFVPPPASEISVFPQAVALEDEVRLEKLNIQDEEFQGTLTADDLTVVQHIVLLSEFQLKKVYLPMDDDIYREELLAYLSYLIESPKSWGIQMVALLNRSVLEKEHPRTVERAMKQLQTLNRVVESEEPLVAERFKYIYAANMPLYWEIELSLGKVLRSLNLHKEALDISLRLKRWEDVIQCYTDLSLRHKAEEVIREQLKTNDTVKLWTLLGDATDNTEYYEHAWKLSGMKSARAKRQWGFHCFQKKLYKEAVTHLEESLKLNPLENPAWLRLGFAALEIENWEISSKAYQHSTSLDADNFEAWNNLAKSFVMLGHKVKALRALREATKCNFDNWKVWENTLVVATDCRAFDEVIQAYNRLFDLKGKWIDVEVLGVLVSAIMTDKLDSTQNSSRDRYLGTALKLFGRITATVTNNPKIWKLYGELLLVKVEADAGGPDEGNWYKSVTFSQRAVQSVLVDPNWTKSEQAVVEAVEFCLYYMKSVSQFIKTFPESLSKSESLTAMQFTVKRVFNAIKKISETSTLPEKFEELLETLKNNATTSFPDGTITFQ